MDFISVIEDKKSGRELSKEQLTYFANAAARHTVPDYQLSALLMAIRLQGMTPRETADLTLAMANSGDMLTPDVGGVALDKHSTGGVGDTTTLVLAPLVAACGGKVLKMSGRGLGHTGGTLDKLESIPGMSVNIDEQRFLEIVRTVGCAVAGQTKELAPADKTLYALRDVTATVDSIPLIASSILSKKFASGAGAIVLDVKTGSGSLMGSLEKSIDLAKTMVEIGTHAGRNIRAVISGMDEPLGSHVGNALEVKEAIDVLSGRVRGPLLDVSLFLGCQMLLTGGLVSSEEEAMLKLRRALKSGAGLAKLKEMIAAQGGDAAVCDDVSLLPQAPVITDIIADRDGYLGGMDTTRLGLVGRNMGAGRVRKEDPIDPAVGFVMKKRIGDRVKKGDVLCTLHARTEESAAEARDGVLGALRLQDAPCPPAPLILALVTPEGVRRF
ncbi:MAG: thymidine phosphorylase [Clostridiales bacterium]|nr:thymidine phosphorylase [Clostridiales bacterium]